MTTGTVKDSAVGQSRSTGGLCGIPFVSQDDFGNAVFEWWNGERKITVYPLEGVLIKIWGPNMVTEMEDVDMINAQAVRDAFDWLTHN